MKGDLKPRDSAVQVSKKMPAGDGLRTAAKTAPGPAQSLHKRAGSTGTTGDESCTTDEEEDRGSEPFGSYSGSDKAMRGHSSDGSMCSLDSKSAASGGFERLEWSDAKEQFVSLQNELREANEELKVRGEEVTRLGRIRRDQEAELEDLTASLFQEAHNMVREANEKQAVAEKALKESQMKVDVLTAEVSALKTLVLTSTPSCPNPHLHPQINGAKDENGGNHFRKHRRTPSHFNLKYGRENSPPDSPVKEVVHISCEVESKEGLEVDPLFHKEFLAWRQNPSTAKKDPFVKRIYNEDIDLCLRFTNNELSEKVVRSVESGTILVEAVCDRTKAMFPKKCALLEVSRLCFYRMNIGETDTWYNISQICRNRIIAVCDFLNYLKYIERGLVKSSAHDVYWEVVRLRKNMILARLGLNIES